MEASPRLRFPPAWFYAVIQMDPLAMVKDLGLDDSETLCAIEALHPKKYLVHVNIVLDLPMPTGKWCRYSIKVVANTLCLEDRKRKILPNMVVPIFPNMQCSSDTRPPIRPLREFPFNNCFHWLPLESNSYIRMRRPSPDVDFSKVIRLDWDQDFATSRTFRQDYDRMRALPSQPHSDKPSSAAISSCDGYIHAVPDWALFDPVVRQACSPIDFSQMRRLAIGEQSSNIPPPEYVLDSSNHSISSCATENDDPWDGKRPEVGADDALDLTMHKDEMAEVADLAKLNIFGWDPDPTFPLVPLVDLWFDLEEHLTPENIPSPKE